MRDQSRGNGIGRLRTIFSDSPGGGSIARVDEGGSLRVGPESAGADPGPASYGRSFLPTVTDAHVVLGHFPGATLLGGEFKLDEDRARRAFDQLASDMTRAAKRKVSRVEAAQGVLDVVTTCLLYTSPSPRD